MKKSGKKLKKLFVPYRCNDCKGCHFGNHCEDKDCKYTKRNVVVWVDCDGTEVIKHFDVYYTFYTCDGVPTADIYYDYKEPESPEQKRKKERESLDRFVSMFSESERNFILDHYSK